MKWGRKRSSPSSPRGSIMTHVFPVSWFSKFKNKGGDPATNSAKKKQRGKLNFPTQKPPLPAGWREARFYSVDNDAYWSLSFRKERTQGGRTTVGIDRLCYDSDDDQFQVPFSSLKSSGLREREVPERGLRSFNKMVLDKKKMKEKQHKKKILRENGAFRSKKPNGEAKKDVNDRCSRKLNCRVVRKKEVELERGPDDGEEKSLKLVERDIFPIETGNMDQMKEGFWDSALSNSRNQHNNVSFPNFSPSSVEELYAFAALNEEGRMATSENKKFKEVKSKTVPQRKFAYKSRESHSSKIKQNQAKAFSAKTECRVRVLEDMKKARMKLKKKDQKEQVAEGRTIFDSFAVVKSSFNPQQDFRDSMVEMISEKGIRRTEELEELLACYLTLNSDGYHDLIIKIFQQVWFELNRGVCRF